MEPFLTSQQLDTEWENMRGLFEDPGVSGKVSKVKIEQKIVASEIKLAGGWGYKETGGRMKFKW